MRPTFRTLMLTALLGAVITPMLPSTPAQAAPCAGKTARYVSGTVYGQDGRDVNVSLGFDVLDAYKRPINADPSTSDYGCLKNSTHGGYSVRPKELNHFVTFEGVAQGTTMPQDGKQTTRTWSVGTLPANAKYLWVEVYSRGWKGSYCKDNLGNWCMNPADVTKYGYANRQLIPVGATNQSIALPTTCKYGGKAGSISGNVKTTAGAAYSLKSVYAWTMNPYNVGPWPQGWGSAAIYSGGNYKVNSLASGQKYRMWAITTTGKTIVVKDVYVNACQNTAKYIRG